MKKTTVKRRIFLSNAWMVLVTLLMFLVINGLVAKLYAETIEREFRTSMEGIVQEAALENILADYTIHRNEFLILVLGDGILCIAVFILVSQIATKRLTEHIMTPLNALAEAAKRVRKNDLTKDIQYQGEVEFEEVCHTFNEMQESILTAQEQNRTYQKARTDMIAGISHDLRTPLTAIRGTVKGLLDGVAVTPEQQEKFLQTAYRRTEDMEVLLEQLLYLSKLETGNMPLILETVEIAEFIKGYVTDKQALFTKEQIEIVADTGKISGNVLIDTKQLFRVFDNLLENSRKYAETEPLKITITINSLDSQFEIRFSDNGVGVSKEKLPYVFQEFYRGDESRNQKEGNGLGLYIVKYLIEAMGGSVRAENAGGFSVCMLLKKQ